jgi:hypothetical protein
MRLAVFGMTVALACLARPAAADPESWVLDSRAAAGQLGSQLMAELTGALQSSPADAIGVCRDRAPAIAAAVGARTGADLGRTALRVRNPANAPTDWQRLVLESFATQLAAGADPAGLEFTDTVISGGVTERRWMKPILTGPMCLQCHGSALAPGVADALTAAYPDDQATGFGAGELRGAFYVVWRRPAAE